MKNTRNTGSNRQNYDCFLYIYTVAHTLNSSGPEENLCRYLFVRTQINISKLNYFYWETRNII